jgi:hypothetical protein
MEPTKTTRTPEQERRHLIACRGARKAVLTRLKYRMDGEPIDSVRMLQLMVEKAMAAFSEYENISIEIGDDEDPTDTETCFYECVSEIRTRIDELTAAAAPAPASALAPGPSSQPISRLKLPDIHLEPFFGKYTEYNSFIEMFNALVHNNEGFDSIQKFFYLRSFVKGEPYDLIKNLPVIGASYTEALKILADRYDNKCKIINEHINGLFELPVLTKSSVSVLRSLISVTKQHLAALKNLGESVDKWDSLLICLLTKKLDPLTSRAYHLDRDNKKEPTFNDLLKFLEDRALALENSEVREPSYATSKAASTSAKVANVVAKTITCLFCGKSNHRLFACPKFTLASVLERLAFVKDRDLCKICLSSHPGRCKFHFKCKQCKESHNSLLHVDEERSTVSLSSVSNKNQVLLPTAKVKLVSKQGEEVIVKALLDSGSQSSFVTAKVAKKLGYALLPNTTDIIGIANTERSVKHRLRLEIFSCVYPFKTQTNLLVVDSITTKLPQSPIDMSKIVIPNNIQLADDSFHMSSDIDMLLAADIFFQALLPQPEQLRQGDAAQLSLVHTQFGYIVGGNVPASVLKQPAVTLFCQDCQTNIHDTISEFWQTEKVPEVSAEHTSEQQYCEQLFSETVKLEENKFTVTLPLKIPIYDVNNTLGDSFGLALKRFINLEKRLIKDQKLYSDYKDFIHEYLDLGHGSYIDISSYDLSKDPVYILPHHAVVRPDAVSTKFRTVFDASMKTSNKLSLNDILLNGPIVQQDLFDILLSFRVHKYFFACDIRRMFRNILIKEEQRPLQNILWRDNPAESIKCIQLKTVSYGMKCSSYLSTRCLKELAIRFQSQYPLASSALLNSTYVDDVLYTDESLAKIVEAKTQLIDLLAKGSLELHKWAANDHLILANILADKCVVGELELNKDIKTLGIKFDLSTDSFKLSCPASNQVPMTKRQILSFISQFYDPLGVAGPVFVQAKIIMQKFWESATAWDSMPPPVLQKEWLQFYNDLIAMKEIKIRREVTVDEFQSAQIVAFADASISAYGAVIYLRVTDKHGKVTMSLLCSKSRIAPKDKKLSVPRLELNASLLMAKLCLRTYNTLCKKIPIESVRLFSDSQVVLAWQKTDPTKLNAYVANRIKLINEYTKGFQWLYIRTDLNPADCLSRGVNPSELQNNQLWWSGPACMSDPEYNFVDSSCDIPKDLPEVKRAESAKLVCAASQGSISLANELLDRYSNINKAVNVLAYLQRFSRNARPGSQKIKLNFISFSEASQALHFFIKEEQAKYFEKELASLRAGKQVSSYLQSVNPFIDANGVLRVGGRLQHSSLPYSQRHQIILPKESKVTYLIIENEHLKLLHASQKEVLSSLSQRYWIVNGLRLVKKFVNKCLTCFRLKGVTAKQLMGSLPAGRVNIDRVFAKVGIDFAGPIMIKQSRVRSVITTKGYIAVYVCFVTKAVHLELVSDLTTDTFLASYKRFISRRNVPTEVFCDNAATFKSASTKLSELYKLNNNKCHQMQVQNVTAKLGTTFHFIPSYSPVFGALWEAAVKSVKYHLKRVLCSHVLTFEELYTVLVQIEGILNSRPITPMSSDIEDMSFLTPAHFLTGASLTCYPEQDITNLPENRLKFWRRCTALQQHFWRYWSKQYLNVLQNRPKWKTSVPNVKEGALVILRELDTPPMTWPMARVTKTFPGHDGKVRALEVKKANGKVHTTSITKVCILPLDE